MTKHWTIVILAWMWLAASAGAQEMPMFTGKDWEQASEQQKKIYLAGVANLIQLEASYNAANPPPDSQSVIPRYAKGLKALTLDRVREALDRWYAANPDKLQRPVVETIWFEMIVPTLKTGGALR